MKTPLPKNHNCVPFINSKDKPFESVSALFEHLHDGFGIEVNEDPYGVNLEEFQQQLDDQLTANVKSPYIIHFKVNGGESPYRFPFWKLMSAYVS